MCRLLAYVGPRVSLHALLYEPEHALVVQSYAPRRQRHGRINADGFGAGWYAPDVRPEPARYRTTTPMWADNSFESIAGVITSGVVLAAVRNATPGLPVDESCTPPYTHGRWLFAHNGRVDEFPGPTANALRRALTDERLAHLQGATDSEVLFGLLLDQIAIGAPAPEAMSTVIRKVQAVGPASRLNLCLTDGRTVVASAAGDSLFTRRDDNGGVVVASEPFDDDAGWHPIDDNSLVVATDSSLDIGAIP
jgi:glutamine amidotransferase